MCNCKPKNKEIWTSILNVLGISEDEPFTVEGDEKALYIFNEGLLKRGVKQDGVVHWKLAWKGRFIDILTGKMAIHPLPCFTEEPEKQEDKSSEENELEIEGFDFEDDWDEDEEEDEEEEFPNDCEDYDKEKCFDCHENSFCWHAKHVRPK